MFSEIVNPITNKKVKLNSASGKRILENYKKFLQKGGGNHMWPQSQGTSNPFSFGGQTSQSQPFSFGGQTPQSQPFSFGGQTPQPQPSSMDVEMIDAFSLDTPPSSHFNKKQGVTSMSKTEKLLKDHSRSEYGYEQLSPINTPTSRGRYYLAMLDGGVYNNQFHEIAKEIVKVNVEYNMKNEYRFSRGQHGTWNQGLRCGGILPKKDGCYSCLLLDTRDSEPPSIVGYVVATKETNDAPPHDPFVMIDYVEIHPDSQGEGLCRLMLTQFIKNLKTYYGTHSFKIQNAAYIPEAGRRCYINSARDNGMNVFFIPKDNGRRNFPYWLPSFCKVWNYGQDTGYRVNWPRDTDAYEYLYMVDKGWLEHKGWCRH